MPVYEWRCENPKCQKKIAVHRSLRDYKRGPDAVEARNHGCDGLKFKRILSNSHAVYVHEDERQYSR